MRRLWYAEVRAEDREVGRAARVKVTISFVPIWNEAKASCVGPIERGLGAEPRVQAFPDILASGVV